MPSIRVTPAVDSGAVEYTKDLKYELKLTVVPEPLSYSPSQVVVYQAVVGWISANLPSIGTTQNNGKIYPNSIKTSRKPYTNVFEATVQYSQRMTPETRQTAGPNGTVYPSEYSFDATGETVHIDQSYSTITALPFNGHALSQFGGGIGAKEDGSFEGCDVKRPRYSWTETQYFPFTFFSRAYQNVIKAMCGCVNAEPFRNFAIGEVLFEGANGSTVYDSQADEYYWKISYAFTASENWSNHVIPGIAAPISKKAWDYLWILREKEVQEIANADGTTTQKIVNKPACLYIEQVYPYADFGVLLLTDSLLPE